MGGPAVCKLTRRRSWLGVERPHVQNDLVEITDLVVSTTPDHMSSREFKSAILDPIRRDMIAGKPLELMKRKGPGGRTFPALKKEAGVTPSRGQIEGSTKKICPREDL